MVNVYVPATTELLGVSVSVEVPVGVTLAGDQAEVTPVGTPVTDIVTEELNSCFGDREPFSTTKPSDLARNRVPFLLGPRTHVLIRRFDTLQSGNSW